MKFVGPNGQATTNAAHMQVNWGDFVLPYTVIYPPLGVSPWCEVSRYSASKTINTQVNK